METNLIGTLAPLEAALATWVECLLSTNTTSLFGDAMRLAPSHSAARLKEKLVPRHKNISGATKLSAEALCWPLQPNHGLHCIVLRTSQFLHEADDDRFPVE